MSGNMIEFEETSCESVILQRIFLECDTYWSKKHKISMVSISREVPISAILEYVKDNLPSCRLDLLVDLRKCLEAVAPEGFINWEQFRESSQHWMTKIDSFGWQDDNNNAYKESQRIVELRTRIRRFEEENDNLREETSRAVELLTVLRRQRDSFKRELDRCTEKCQQLEKDNDERKDALNEVIRKERTSSSALKSSMKRCESLQRKLDAADLEMQAMASTKNELNKVTKENAELTKQVEKTQNDFDEKQQECETLKLTIDKIEETYASMRQAQEQMIRDLREKNRQFMDENLELRSLSTINTCSFEDRFRTSPYPNIRHCSIYDTLSMSDRGDCEENSLFVELKASGFTTECGRNDSRNRELEEELEIYDVKIRNILKQVEGVIQDLAAVWKTSYTSALQLQEGDADDERMQTLEALAQKMSFLVRMVSNATTKSSTRDACTQVEAELAPRENLRDFGITTFHDFLKDAHRVKPPIPAPFVKPDIDLTDIRNKEHTRSKTPDRLRQCTRMSCLEKEIGRQKRMISSPVPLSFSTPLFPRRKDTIPPERRKEIAVENHPKHEKRRRRLPIGCALTETNNNTQSCTNRLTKVKPSLCEQQRTSPILSGLADAPFCAQTFTKSPETETLHSDDASEEEVERKYTTFSIGLRTDRMTVNSRLQLSIRQRDLAEKDLATEVEQMQKVIQGFSPRRSSVETLERVEELRGRLEVVGRCVEKMCRAAETVGAVQQERRFLEAVLTADRHFQVLRSRCKNLAAEVAETKSLLWKNSSLTKANLDRRRDGVSKSSCRAGLLQAESGSRKTEDTVRHSSRFPGKVRLRRRQTLESHEWESEDSTRTQNSTSTLYSSKFSETSDYSILEHSNRKGSSREKERQAVKGSDTPSIVYYSAENSEAWSSANNKSVSTSAPAEKDVRETESRVKMSVQKACVITKNVAAYRSILWYILIFFMGFYVNHIIRVGNACQTPSLKWWSIEEILSPYFKVKKKVPPPI